MGLDPAGGPLIDPTANVIALNKAGHVRQDDLRKAERRYVKAELKRAKDRAKFVEKYTKVHQRHDYALHKAEAARLDALRQSDREDVKALAAATTAKAEALQSQGATTAKTLADSFASAMAEQNKRVSAVELAQSEGRGKATVESPMMAEMVSKIEALTLTIASNSGQKQGVTDARIWLGWAIAALVGLFALFQTVRGR